METKNTQLQTIIQAGHAEAVNSIAISPDSQYLASASRIDYAVKLWDLETGKLIRNFVGHNNYVTSVVFSSDKKYLLTGGWDGVFLWEVQSGKCLQKYDKGLINSVCFTPDNNNIITAGDEKIDGKILGVAYLWDLFSQNAEQGVQYYPKLIFGGSVGHTDTIFSASISSNSKYLATGSKDGTVKLWDLKTAGLLKTFIHSTTAFVYSIVFDPADDPQYIISAGSAGTPGIPGNKIKAQQLKFWDIKSQNTKQAKLVLSGHSDNIYAAAISADGSYLASCSEDKTICLWNLKDEQMKSPVFQSERHEKELYAVCFSKNGSYLAYGGADEVVTLWDIKEKKITNTFRGYTAIVFAAAITSDGKYLVEGGKGNLIRIWDLSNNSGYKILYKEDVKLNPKAEIRAIDISPDGKLWAFGTDNLNDNSIGGSIRIWNVEQNKPFKDFQCDQPVFSVRFSEDGKFLAAGCSDSKYCYWNLANEKPEWLQEKSSSFYTYVDINITKGYLVAGFHHKTKNEPFLILIDLKNKNKKLILHYESDTDSMESIQSVRISQNGCYLVAAHTEWINLWDLNDVKKKSRQLNDPENNWVNALDISKDGRFVLSSCLDNKVRLTDTSLKSDVPVQIFTGHSSEVYARFSPDEKYIISASKDCSTKIWNRETGKELATLVSIGEADWAVLTPSGSFDASPGAMQKMHYVSGMEVIELDQLKGRYWEPNLLSILLNFKAGNLKNVAELTALALYPEVISMEIKDDKLLVKLESRSGGIGRTSLRINNKEREPDINKARTTSFSIDLKQYERFFAAGENSIAIRCWNKDDWLPGQLRELIYIKKGITKAAPPCLYAFFVVTTK